MRHAGLRAFLAIGAGVLLQHLASLPPWFLIGYAVLALGAAWLTRGWSLLLILTAVAALGYDSAVPVVHPEAIDSRPLKYDVVVLSEPIPRKGGRNYEVEIRSVTVGNRRLPLDIKARFGTGRYLRYGTRLRLTGILSRFNYPRNPGLFDLNRHFARQGLAGALRATGGVVTLDGQGGNLLLRTVVMPVRRHIVDVLGRWFTGSNRALLAGLLLGEKGDLPEETVESFADAGITHVLAVSGLNVSIVVGALILLLMTLRISGGLRLGLLITATVVYIGVTGFAPSALRAGLMAIMVSIGLFFERRYDSLNGICIAGIIMLTLDPAALLDVGFQLSFSAMAAIVLFYDRILNLLNRPGTPRLVRNWVLSPLAVVIAAQLGTLPLSIYYFYQFSIIALIANLVVVPLVGIATPLGLLTVAMPPPLTGFLAPVLDLLLTGIIRLGEGFGGQGWAALAVGRPPVLLIVWLYVLILLLLALPRNWAKRALIYSSLAGLGVIAWSRAFPPSVLRVTFLDQRQTQSVFIEFPNGRNLLIDAGRGDDRIAATYLKSRGVTRLNLLAVTHPDRHVLDGISTLLDRVQVERVLVPLEPEADSEWRAALAKGHAPVSVLSRGDRIDGLGAELTVISPTPLLRRFHRDRLLSANDLSLVLRLDYQDCSVLLPADLDNPTLLAGVPVQTTILHAAHQGSIRANSDTLLDAVNPNLVIISGRRPNARLTDSLTRRGIPVHSTRQAGAAILTIRNSRATIETMGIP